MGERVVVCADLGGTKVALGLVNEAGHILARDRYLLGERREPAYVAGELVTRLNQLLNQAGLSWANVPGVGCSVAGVLDVSEGLIRFAANLIGPARNVPFRKMLVEAIGRPVWLEMDAQAAALGEAWQGAGVGADHLLYLVVGTGVGAGLILDGRVYHGWGDTAGELGHTTVDPAGPLCNCGNSGCLEAVASGPAMAQRASLALEQGRPSLIRQLAGDAAIEAKLVMQAARQGDALAQEIIHQTAEYLAIGLANAFHLLSPQVMVLGGGVIQGGADLLLEPIRAAVARRVGSWIDRPASRIVLATLGEDAALLGAARQVWLNALESQS